MNVWNHCYWTIIIPSDHDYTVFFIMTFDCASNFRLYAFLGQFQLFTQTRTMGGRRTRPHIFLPKRSVPTVLVTRMPWFSNTVIRGSDGNQLSQKTSLSYQLSTSVTNNWSSTKVLWYFSSIILSTAIWISSGRGYRLHSIIRNFCIQSKCSLFGSFACCYSS